MDKLFNWEHPKSEDSKVALAILGLAVLGFLAYFFTGQPAEYPQSLSHHESAQHVFR